MKKTLKYYIFNLWKGSKLFCLTFLSKYDIICPQIELDFNLIQLINNAVLSTKKDRNALYNYK